MTDDAKKPLGRILLQQRALTQAELDAALARGGSASTPLATRLTESGAVSEVAALKALSEQSGVPGIDLTQVCIKLADLEVLPREVAVRHKILPVLVRDDRVFVAMATPGNHKIIDEIEFVSGKHVYSYIALDGPLMRAIQDAYDARDRGELHYIGPLCPPDVLRKLGIFVEPAGVREVSPPNRVDPRAEDSRSDIFVPIQKSDPKAPASHSQFRRVPTEAPRTEPPDELIEEAEELIEEIEPELTEEPTPVARQAPAVSAPPPPETQRAGTAPRREPTQTAPPPPDYAEQARSLQVAAPPAPSVPLIVDDAMHSASVEEDVSYAGFDDPSSAVVDVSGALQQRDSRMRVLVVEENDALRGELRRGFEARGYAVIEASGGIIALKLMKEQTPNLVVLPAMLKEVHGFEIARRIKGSERYGHIPVVLTSPLQRGAAFGEDVKKSYGVEAYLERPFRVEDVVRAAETGFAMSKRHTHADKIAEEAERLLKAGIEAYRSGEIDMATRYLMEGARVDPLAFRLHFHLGLLHGKKGQIYDAIAALETAVELNPADFSAQKNLAVVYQKAGFRSRAVETWQRALAVAPDEATRASIVQHLERLAV